MVKSIKQRAAHRIKIIQGLLNKLEASVTSEEYCIDIIKQSFAIQKALSSLDALLLEQHLNSCVKHGMKSGATGERMRQELQDLFQFVK